MSCLSTATSLSERKDMWSRASLGAKKPWGREDPCSQVPVNLQIMKLRNGSTWRFCPLCGLPLPTPASMYPRPDSGVRQITGTRGLAFLKQKTQTFKVTNHIFTWNFRRKPPANPLDSVPNTGFESDCPSFPIVTVSPVHMVISFYQGPHYRSLLTGISTSSKRISIQRPDPSFENVHLIMSFSLFQTLQWLLSRLQIKSKLTKSYTVWPLPAHVSRHKVPAPWASSSLRGNQLWPTCRPAIGIPSAWAPLFAWSPLLKWTTETASERPSATNLSEARPLRYSLPIGPYPFFIEFITIYNYFINALAHLFIVKKVSYTWTTIVSFSLGPSIPPVLSYLLSDPQHLTGWLAHNKHSSDKWIKMQDFAPPPPLSK